MAASWLYKCAELLADIVAFVLIVGTPRQGPSFLGCLNFDAPLCEGHQEGGSTFGGREEVLSEVSSATVPKTKLFERLELKTVWNEGQQLPRSLQA